MHGQMLEKYCPSCKEDVKLITTILYMVDGKEYTDKFDCPKCNEDLAKEERELIEDARKTGKSVIAVMC